MKLSELKRICEGAAEEHAKECRIHTRKFKEEFSPSRVKKMIELLESAEVFIHSHPCGCDPGNGITTRPYTCIKHEWLKDFNDEFGE